MGTLAPLCLVTGATGFIASWVCRTLVDRGYRVRGTVRDKNSDKAAHLRHMGVELYEADLLKDHSFDGACEGVTFVHHLASPFFFKPPTGDANNDFVVPAVKGTLNVLESARKAGSVRKLVLTSSCASITHHNPDSKAPDYVWTEEDWQMDAPVDAFGGYRASKREAELAAWRFVKDHPGCFDLVVMNPAFVIGPCLSKYADGASVSFQKSLIDGSTDKVATGGFGVVDVRDVAEAHVRAQEKATSQLTPNSQGQYRYILSSESAVPFLELADMLRNDHRFAGYPIPRQKQDGPERPLLRYSNAHARHDLGMVFSAPQRAIVDAAVAFLELGVVEPVAHAAQRHHTEA